MKNHTMKPMPCTLCGANSFRLVLIIRDENANMLRAYCNKCQAARDTKVGVGNRVYTGRPRGNTKEE